MKAYIEEEVSLLQAVLDVTRSLCSSAIEGDVNVLEDLLHKRERLLQTIMGLHEEVKEQLQTDEAKDEANARVAPVLQAIQAANEKFVGALHARRKQIVAKLLELQQQKAIFKYSH